MNNKAIFYIIFYNCLINIWDYDWFLYKYSKNLSNIYHYNTFNYIKLKPVLNHVQVSKYLKK